MEFSFLSFLFLFCVFQQARSSSDMTDLVRTERNQVNHMHLRYADKNFQLPCDVAAFGPVNFDSQYSSVRDTVILSTIPSDGCGELIQLDLGLKDFPNVPKSQLSLKFPGRLVVAVVEQSNRCSFEEQSYNANRAGADVLVVVSRFPGLELRRMSPISSKSFGNGFYENGRGVIHTCMMSHEQGTTLRHMVESLKIVKGSIEREPRNLFFHDVSPGLVHGDELVPGEDSIVEWRSSSDHYGAVTIEVFHRGNENEVYHTIASDFVPPVPLKLKPGQKLEDIKGIWRPKLQEDADVEVIYFWIPEAPEHSGEYEESEEEPYDKTILTPFRVRWKVPDHFRVDVPYSIRITSKEGKEYVQGESMYPVRYMSSRPYLSITQPATQTQVWVANSEQTIAWNLYSETGRSPLSKEQAQSKMPYVTIHLIKSMDDELEDYNTITNPFSIPLHNKYGSTQLVNTGEFEFKLQRSIPVGEYFVRVSSGNNKGLDFAVSEKINIINSLVEISTFDLPGEKVALGHEVVLKWSYMGNLNEVNIYLQQYDNSTNNYKHVASIAKEVHADNGGFNWVVFGAVGNGYRIMIEDADPTHASVAYSEFDFSIVDSHDNGEEAKSSKALLVILILLSVLLVLGMMYYCYYKRPTADVTEQTTVSGIEARGPGAALKGMLKRTPSLEELLPGAFSRFRSSDGNDSDDHAITHRWSWWPRTLRFRTNASKKPSENQEETIKSTELAGV